MRGDQEPEEAARRPPAARAASDAPGVCTRRAVLVGVAGCAIACGGGQAPAAVPSHDGRIRLPLAKFPDLGRDGGSAVVEVDDEPVIVLRRGGGEVAALSLRCTHQGCVVSWKPAASELQCPCHGSRFSATGEVLEGPAKRPLPSYEARLEGEEVIVRVDEAGSTGAT
jgi:cytochrome b6-f complex iron-sulfur subunit